MTITAIPGATPFLLTPPVSDLPVEGVAGSSDNAHRKNLPDQPWSTCKHNDFVGPGTPGKPVGIVPTGPLAQNLLLVSNPGGELPRHHFIDLAKQILMPRLLDGFLNLIRTVRGGSITARRVTKNKGVVEFEFLDHGARGRG